MGRRAKNAFGRATGAKFTIGDETGGNNIVVNAQLFGGVLQGRVKIDWYLSGDENGDSIISTAPSGGVAAGTDGHVTALVTGKSGWAVSEADGSIDFSITEAAAKTDIWLVIVLPDGSLQISDEIIFA